MREQSRVFPESLSIYLKPPWATSLMAALDKPRHGQPPSALLAGARVRGERGLLKVGPAAAARPPSAGPGGFSGDSVSVVETLLNLVCNADSSLLSLSLSLFLF